MKRVTEIRPGPEAEHNGPITHAPLSPLAVTDTGS